MTLQEKNDDDEPPLVLQNCSAMSRQAAMSNMKQKPKRGWGMGWFGGANNDNANKRRIQAKTKTTAIVKDSNMNISKPDKSLIPPISSTTSSSSVAQSTNNSRTALHPPSPKSLSPRQPSSKTGMSEDGDNKFDAPQKSKFSNDNENNSRANVSKSPDELSRQERREEVRKKTAWYEEYIREQLAKQGGSLSSLSKDDIIAMGLFDKQRRLNRRVRLWGRRDSEVEVELSDDELNQLLVLADRCKQAQKDDAELENLLVQKENNIEVDMDRLYHLELLSRRRLGEILNAEELEELQILEEKKKDKEDLLDLLGQKDCGTLSDIDEERLKELTILDRKRKGDKSMTDAELQEAEIIQMRREDARLNEKDFIMLVRLRDQGIHVDEDRFNLLSLLDRRRRGREITESETEMLEKYFSLREEEYLDRIESMMLIKNNNRDIDAIDASEEVSERTGEPLVEKGEQPFVKLTSDKEITDGGGEGGIIGFSADEVERKKLLDRKDCGEPINENRLYELESMYQERDGDDATSNESKNVERLQRQHVGNDEVTKESKNMEVKDDNDTKSGSTFDETSISDSEKVAFERFLGHLEEQGLPLAISFNVICEEKELDMSTVSFGDETYIKDLVFQKESRQNERKDECLEIAYELYKRTIKKKNLPESEEMLLRMFADILKEKNKEMRKADEQFDDLVEQELSLYEIRKQDIQNKEKENAHNDSEKGHEILGGKMPRDNMYTDNHSGEEIRREIEDEKKCCSETTEASPIFPADDKSTSAPSSAFAIRENTKKENYPEQTMNRSWGTGSNNTEVYGASHAEESEMTNEQSLLEHAKETKLVRTEYILNELKSKCIIGITRAKDGDGKSPMRSQGDENIEGTLVDVHSPLIPVDRSSSEELLRKTVVNDATVESVRSARFSVEERIMTKDTMMNVRVGAWASAKAEKEGNYIDNDESDVSFMRHETLTTIDTTIAIQDSKANDGNEHSIDDRISNKRGVDSNKSSGGVQSCNVETLTNRTDIIENNLTQNETQRDHLCEKGCDQTDLLHVDELGSSKELCRVAELSVEATPTEVKGLKKEFGTRHKRIETPERNPEGHIKINKHQDGIETKEDGVLQVDIESQETENELLYELELLFRLRKGLYLTERQDYELDLLKLTRQDRPLSEVELEDLKTLKGEREQIAPNEKYLKYLHDRRSSGQSVKDDLVYEVDLFQKELGGDALSEDELFEIQLFERRLNGESLAEDHLRKLALLKNQRLGRNIEGQNFDRKNESSTCEVTCPDNTNHFCYGIEERSLNDRSDRRQTDYHSDGIKELSICDIPESLPVHHNCKSNNDDPINEISNKPSKSDRFDEVKDHLISENPSQLALEDHPFRKSNNSVGGKSIRFLEEERSLQSLKKERSMQSLNRGHSMRRLNRERSMESLKKERSMRRLNRERSMESLKKERSMRHLNRERSMQSLKKERSMRHMNRERSMGSLKRERSMRSLKRERSMRLFQKERSIRFLKKERSIRLLQGNHSFLRNERSLDDDDSIYRRDLLDRQMAGQRLDKKEFEWLRILMKKSRNEELDEDDLEELEIMRYQRNETEDDFVNTKFLLQEEVKRQHKQKMREQRRKERRERREQRRQDRQREKDNMRRKRRSRIESNVDRIHDAQGDNGQKADTINSMDAKIETQTIGPPSLHLPPHPEEPKEEGTTRRRSSVFGGVFGMNAKKQRQEQQLEEAKRLQAELIKQQMKALALDNEAEELEREKVMQEQLVQETIEKKKTDSSVGSSSWEANTAGKFEDSDSSFWSSSWDSSSNGDLSELEGDVEKASFEKQNSDKVDHGEVGKSVELPNPLLNEITSELSGTETKVTSSCQDLSKSNRETTRTFLQEGKEQTLFDNKSVLPGEHIRRNTLKSGGMDSNKERIRGLEDSKSATKRTSLAFHLKKKKKRNGTKRTKHGDDVSLGTLQLSKLLKDDLANTQPDIQSISDQVSKSKDRPWIVPDATQKPTCGDYPDTAQIDGLENPNEQTMDESFDFGHSIDSRISEGDAEGEEGGEGEEESVSSKEGSIPSVHTDGEDHKLVATEQDNKFDEENSPADSLANSFTSIGQEDYDLGLQEYENIESRLGGKIWDKQAEFDLTWEQTIADENVIAQINQRLRERQRAIETKKEKMKERKESDLKEFPRLFLFEGERAKKNGTKRRKKNKSQKKLDRTLTEEFRKAMKEVFDSDSDDDYRIEFKESVRTSHCSIQDYNDFPIHSSSRRDQSDFFSADTDDLSDTFSLDEASNGKSIASDEESDELDGEYLKRLKARSMPAEVKRMLSGRNMLKSCRNLRGSRNLMANQSTQSESSDEHSMASDIEKGYQKGRRRPRRKKDGEIVDNNIDPAEVYAQELERQNGKKAFTVAGLRKEIEGMRRSRDFSGKSDDFGNFDDISPPLLKESKVKMDRAKKIKNIGTSLERGVESLERQRPSLLTAKSVRSLGTTFSDQGLLTGSRLERHRINGLPTRAPETIIEGDRDGEKGDSFLGSGNDVNDFNKKPRITGGNTVLTNLKRLGSGGLSSMVKAYKTKKMTEVNNAEVGGLLNEEPDDEFDDSEAESGSEMDDSYNNMPALRQQEPLPLPETPDEIRQERGNKLFQKMKMNGMLPKLKLPGKNSVNRKFGGGIMIDDDDGGNGKEGGMTGLL